MTFREVIGALLEGKKIECKLKSSRDGWYLLRMSTLQDSILIPKPKFKVGDVTLPKGSKQAFQVVLRSYNLPFGNWAYYDTQTDVWWWEQELELVEEGVENV